MGTLQPSDVLSQREFQVAERYARGENFRDIAEGLGIAPSTVRTHLAKIYRKLGVSTKVALAEALRVGPHDQTPDVGPLDPVPRSPARRQIASVAYLFVDGFVELARTAPPEDIRTHADTLRKSVSAVALDHGAQVLSHGGGAYALVFGFPQSKEHDAEAAARAAICLQSSSNNLEGTGQIAALSAKIAIFTGHVVVPPRKAGAAAPALDQIVAGFVDIAAEMARTADADRIMACPKTRAAVTVGDFEAATDGSENSVLLRLNDHRTRFRADTLPDHNTFVGRKLEIEMLGELHASCCAGSGQAAQIVGEAGIGKSRLIQEFLHRIQQDGDRVLVAQCDPMDRAQPFAPVRRLLLQIAARKETEAAALREVWGPEQEDSAMLDVAIGEILGDPALGGDLAARSSPELRRARAFDALDALLWRNALNGTLMFACEDVHWADPTSREWLDRLSGSIGNAPILLLTTSRPVGGTHALVGSDVVTLNLRPLTKEQSKALIVAQPESSVLTDERRVQIAERAEGVPLFLEELLRASVALKEIKDVPDTLTGAVRARFDISGDSSVLVEAASVFGRRFETADVAAILKKDPGEVDEELDRIRDTKVIVPVFGADPGHFQFRHALLRDFAYGQLTRERLAMLHKRAAGVLKKKPGAPPVLIAEHLAASGQKSEAAGQFLQAAGIAVGRAANREVIDICERVIALADGLATPAEQLGIELNARILMGVAMQALYGYSAPDVLENYRKARDLCEIAGAREELFPVLRGLFVYNLLAGKLREAYRLALQLIDMADRTGTREHFIESRFALGQIKIYHREDIDEGLALLQAAAERYDTADSARHVRTYGQDPGAFSLALSLFTLVAMGRFEEARQTILAANDLAEQVGHPMSRAAVLVFSSWALHMMKEPDRAVHYAEHARELGRQQLLPAFEFWGDVMHAAAIGDVAPVAQKLGFYEGSGMKFTVVIIVPLLAEQALEAGDIALASEMNRRALDLLATDEAEPCMSAQAYRIAARVDAALGDMAARDAWLERAWAATQATGSHFFAVLVATDALALGLSSEPWTGRLSDALRPVASQLPKALRERAERLLQ